MGELMIRLCQVFRIQDESNQRSSTDLPKQVTLESCTRAASGTLRRRLEGLRGVVRKEILRSDEENSDFKAYSLSAETQAPGMMAIGDEPLPFIEVSFPIWRMKKWPLILVFDAGRKLAVTGACMTSMLWYGEPSMVQPVRLDRDDFLSMIKRVSSADVYPQGTIRRITFRNARTNGEAFKQVTLVGESLEETNLFTSLRDSSSFITELAFLAPMFQGVERRLSSRMTRLGSLTLYSPDMSDFETVRLVEFLETSLTNTAPL